MHTEFAGQPKSMHSVSVSEAKTAIAGASPRRSRACVALRTALSAEIHRITKRALDLIGALMIGFIASPLILVIVVAMIFDDGPVLFRHCRIGYGGKSFECLKFRTMVPNAERLLRDLLARDEVARAEWIRVHKLRNDPRVTRLGRFLRRTSLDELPQLWNIVRGEMSLVGPRPIAREELRRYGRHLPAYLATRPGLTGLWQVTRGTDTDYRRRVAIDVHYMRRQCLMLDLRILLRTPQVVISGRGAH